MTRYRQLVGAVALASALSACSGKTERGSGSSGGRAAAHRPAQGPADVGDAQSASGGHLLMVVELEAARRVARVLTARSLPLPLPRRRGPAPKRPWRADVLDAEGAVLFSQGLEDTSQVRGEFADERGRLQSASTRKSLAAVTLRLPLLAGASEVRIVSVDASGDTELGRVAYPQVKP
jgi:hypothetical protein